MREVSCRAFERLESAARVHGLSLDELVAGLPVTLAELRNPDEWMDWDVHAELCARFERATGPEASVQMGRAIWSLPYGTSLRRVASLAIDLKHLIRIGLQWRLPKVHRNIGVQIADAGRHELEVELTIPAHLRGSPEWLRVMQGALEGAPLARGLPPAQVRAVIDSHRGVYHIALPAQRTDPLALLRTLFGDPALAELDRQVEELRLLEAERARMDAQLRDRERTLSNLITNLSGIVYRCRDDERWTLDFASAGCLALTGYPADELISTHDGLASLVHADDLPALRSRREQARLERASCSEEYRIQTRSGEARWVLDVAQPIYDASGHCEGFEGFITDVTARRRNDEARARLEDELSHSRRLEGLGRLASGITHDLNNWLTVIFANVEFAVNALHRDDPVRPRVEQIRGAAAQAASLTQQVLAFARKQRVQPRMVNLNTRVATIEKLSRRALPHSLQVVMRLDARLGLVEVDPGQIDQVLLNLIVNARDAMPPDGRLCLETQHVTLHAGGEHPATLAPGEYALVTVSDTGSGIREDVRERMFEPFFTTKPAGKGTGLGLASAHGIVRQARGEITFVSVLGCGTAFQIYLPRAGAEPAGHELTHAPELPRGRGELLLIVQPRGLERALRERGYRVLVASTHADALALAARHAGELSLVVMDAALERVPGAELPVPVLYLVGLAGQKPLNARPPAPGSRFLARPFTLLGLLDELRWLLEPPLALSMRPEPEAPFDRV